MARFRMARRLVRRTGFAARRITRTQIARGRRLKWNVRGGYRRARRSAIKHRSKFPILAAAFIYASYKTRKTRKRRRS